MKGIYLGACLARHLDHDLDYNDIDPKTNCNIIGDMLEIDLSKYDYLIASPPCNFYSRANYRRYTSEYSQKTKHLLPGILEKFAKTNKPFIVENVRNYPLFLKEGVIDICNKNNIYIEFIGRHTYFTNIDIYLSNIPQDKENVQGGSYYSLNPNNYRQGGKNVYKVIERFINYIERRE